MKGANSAADANPRIEYTHCYLCSRPLHGQISKDHCPPLALFTSNIRRSHNLSQLITIPVHKDCNSSYQRDEEYFKAIMILFAPGSNVGDSVFDEFMDIFRITKRKLSLTVRIIKEFASKINDDDIPAVIGENHEQDDRIIRVGWKIVRGLYYHHHGVILPESLHVRCSITVPDHPPPNHFLYVVSLDDDKTYGQYPSVFDYRFRVLELDSGKLNYWAFLIWDRITFTVNFHDPWSCQCENCTAALAESNIRMNNPTS